MKRTNWIQKTMSEKLDFVAKSYAGAATGEAAGAGQTVANSKPRAIVGGMFARRRAVMWSVLQRLRAGVKFVLPDYAFILLSHRRRTGRWPNLKHPSTFNEMILERCLHPVMEWGVLADKLRVREYVKRKVGHHHLIPLIATPDVFTREVFDALPASFVMKANHGSGFVKVVREKSNTSFDELNGLARRWLATDFSRAGREQHYRFIEPRLFFEKLLLDKTGKIPADLKLHVFGGRPNGPVVYTHVISDRFGDGRGDVYDSHWRRLEVEIGTYRRSDIAPAQPQNWSEVVRIGTRLAEDFDYVRVDLYSTGDEVFFGELTFTHGAGLFPFRPDGYDFEWGRLLQESRVGFQRTNGATERA
jgi:hypothetical protein